MIVLGESVNGIESGSTGSNSLTFRVGYSESDSGGSDPTHSFGALELPVIELGLFGTSRREDYSVPGGNTRRMSHRQPQMVP